ncbi:putative formin [Trypanosoma vivax]|nr:putative formin [Trypanosoma vivax]
MPLFCNAHNQHEEKSISDASAVASHEAELLCATLPPMCPGSPTRFTRFCRDRSRRASQRDAPQVKRVVDFCCPEVADCDSRSRITSRNNDGAQYIFLSTEELLHLSRAFDATPEHVREVVLAAAGQRELIYAILQDELEDQERCRSSHRHSSPSVHRPGCCTNVGGSLRPKLRFGSKRTVKRLMKFLELPPSWESSAIHALNETEGDARLAATVLHKQRKETKRSSAPRFSLPYEGVTGQRLLEASRYIVNQEMLDTRAVCVPAACFPGNTEREPHKVCEAGGNVMQAVTPIQRRYARKTSPDSLCGSPPMEYPIAHGKGGSDDSSNRASFDVGVHSGIDRAEAQNVEPPVSTHISSGFSPYALSSSAESKSHTFTVQMATPLSWGVQDDSYSSHSDKAALETSKMSPACRSTGGLYAREAVDLSSSGNVSQQFLPELRHETAEVEMRPPSDTSVITHKSTVKGTPDCSTEEGNDACLKKHLNSGCYVAADPNYARELCSAPGEEASLECESSPGILEASLPPQSCALERSPKTLRLETPMSGKRGQGQQPPPPPPPPPPPSRRTSAPFPRQNGPTRNIPIEAVSTVQACSAFGRGDAVVLPRAFLAELVEGFKRPERRTSDSKPSLVGSVSVLPQNREQNIAIILQFLRLPLQTIESSLREFDELTLCEEPISGLHKIVPTEEDRRLIKEWEKRDPTVTESKLQCLSLSTRFVMMTLRIEHYNERVECWNFKNEFNSIIEDAEQKLQRALRGVVAAMEAKCLPQLLQYIIAVGNFLNTGSRYEEIKAFPITQLLSVIEFPTTDGKRILLDHLVEIVAHCNPQLHKFTQELLPAVEYAAGFDLAGISNEVCALYKNLWKCSALARRIPDDKPWVLKLGKFTHTALRDLDRVERLLGEFNAKMGLLPDFFCEPTKNFSMNDTMRCLAVFARKYESRLTKLQEQKGALAKTF